MGVRVFHTADWHLGKTLFRRSRLPEQRRFLENMVGEVRRLDVDLVVIAGDVFETYTPSAGAEELYFETLSELSEGGARAVVVVAGNHDSPERLRAPRSLMIPQGIILAAYPRTVPHTLRRFPGFYVLDSGPGWIHLAFPQKGADLLLHLVPFPSFPRLREGDDGGELELGPETPFPEVFSSLRRGIPEAKNTVLVGHLYVRRELFSPEEREDILDVLGDAYLLPEESLKGYRAAFLGHLHIPHGEGNWRYAGAPMAFNFGDPPTPRGGWLWEGGRWEFVEIPGGMPLLRLEFATVEEALKQAGEYREVWVQLLFPPGVELGREESRALARAYPHLANVGFRIPGALEEAGEFAPGPSLEDPAELFRDFYLKVKGTKPSEELLKLFLEYFREVVADEAPAP